MQKRLAAIDVGTNSIRCIVVEAGPGGDFRVLDDEKATVRLGEGLSATGRLSEAAMGRAAEALTRMRKIIDGLGVEAVEAVATSAVRKAENGRDFLEDMERQTGIAIEVIDGEQEAELAALSAWRHFDMASARYLLVDMGGGSLEVVSAAGRHIEEIFSVELGAVFLTEQFLHSDPVTEKEVSRLRKHVRKTLRRRLDPRDVAVQYLIGSGGTLTTMAQMIKAARREKFDSVHGYEVLHSEVVHLSAMLQRKSARERRAIPGLSPERADIILAGVLAVEELMALYGTNLLRVNERGLREGLILRGLSRHGMIETPAGTPDWRTAVRDFGRSCHMDEEHAEQVCRLSVQLFDALLPCHGLDERARQLLEAAALLHDIGYFISYSQHHKHSYHLIRYGSLFDFTPREKELIANVARYHRKSLPKRKHEGFAALSLEDQVLVRRLGGILRLADGLDRRRSSQVEGLECSLEQGVFHLGIRGAGDLSVEIYGARTKSDLFEEAFGRALVVSEVRGGETGDGPALTGS